MSICVNNYNVTNSKWEKLLSIKVDQVLKFATEIIEIQKHKE